MSNGDLEWKNESHVHMSDSLMRGDLSRSLRSPDNLSDSAHPPHTPHDFAAAYDNVKELERVLRMNMCLANDLPCGTLMRNLCRERLNHIEEDRNMKWKDEAIKHGLKMVEEESECARTGSSETEA
eukprot:753028-Hanusia_phi.AAC.1